MSGILSKRGQNTTIVCPKGSLTTLMQVYPFLTNYCSFLVQQNLNYLVFIGRVMHYIYILTLISEKLICLSREFNPFYEEDTGFFWSLKIGPIVVFSDY